MPRVSEDRRIQAFVTIRTAIPEKACTAASCGGTMYLHDPMEPVPSPAHLEFPTYGSWVCAADPTHVELLTWRACSLARAAYREELLNARILLPRDQQTREAIPGDEQSEPLSIGRRIVAATVRRVSRLFKRTQP
jgi:hypothetical protein